MAADIYVMIEKRSIYKVVNYRQVDSKEHGLVYMLELVAGYDYINPDYSDVQGFVSKEGFEEAVQWYSFTVYPLDETLRGRLAEEGFKVINIKDYTIHPFKGETMSTELERAIEGLKEVRDTASVNMFDAKGVIEELQELGYEDVVDDLLDDRGKIYKDKYVYYLQEMGKAL